LKLRIIFAIVIFFSIFKVSKSQDLNDTSKIIIKRIGKNIPEEYNISSLNLKKDKDINLYVIRVDLQVPIRSKLSLSIKDTANDILMYLINDNVLPAGSYRVRWEMPVCFSRNNCDGYLPGKYLCEFETDQFIYSIDFFIK
jgi:hypothetical protein